MKKFKTQLILVSEQMTPNVTPVMDPDIRPDKVILCASQKMTLQAQNLVRYFQSKHIQTEIYSLGNAFEFNDLQNKFLDLAGMLEAEKEHVGVNITGGNKLMTIAAQMTFFDAGFTCFYVIPNEDSIIMLDSSPAEKYFIKEQMKLEDFFAIHGFKVENISRKRNISAESRELFEKLFKNYDAYKEALRELNYLAALAKEKRSLSIRNDIKKKAWELLALFYAHGAITYYDDQKIEFANDSMRKFCQGFWLEDHVYLQLTKLHNTVTLQDYAGSLEITSPSGTRNEFDAAFLYNNSLYIIECKTSNLAEKGSDVLYKIDSLKDFAGRFTRSIVLSFHSLNPADRQRAKDLGIHLVEGRDLSNLEMKLQKIIGVK